MLEVHSSFLVEATTIHGEGRSRGSYLEQFTKLLLDLLIPNLAEPFQQTILYFTEYWISFLLGIISLDMNNVLVSTVHQTGICTYIYGPHCGMDHSDRHTAGVAKSNDRQLQRFWNLLNSLNLSPKRMSDLWTMQNQSRVQDLPRNTFFQSWE